MCHISTAEVGSLGRLLGNTDSSLTTVILDGLKLSGTPAIKDLLGNLLSLEFELHHEKTCLRGFRPGQHKGGGTTTDNGYMLEI